MCYQLVLVTPLTLSEVRSMLEPGMRADPLDPSAQAPYRALLRGSQTAVLLLTGWCACGLLPERFRDTHTDEAHLRERYRALRVGRDRIIEALDRHRRSSAVEQPAPGALTRFVAEHARNAGTSAWLLGFAPDDAAPPAGAPAVARSVEETRSDADWLVEGAVVHVVR
jgi:hypothetical protein